MYQEQQLLVAELKSPQAQVSHDVLFSSLQTAVEWKFGDDMKSSVKWVYLLSSSQFLVLIDNANITRKLASEVSTELKLNHSHSEKCIDVCFSLVTSTTTFPTEYLLVDCDATILLDLPCDIQKCLAKDLPCSVPTLSFTRCGSIV
jgi:hypothetical protein